MKEILKKYLKRPLPSSRQSYSQLGEDLVIDFIFEKYQITSPSTLILVQMIRLDTPTPIIFTGKAVKVSV